jgi:Tfp pilus assembly protein PilO
MRKGTTALAVMFAGSTILIGLARAETPVVAPTDKDQKALADAKDAKEKEVKKVEKKEVTDAEYIQDLREARTKLNEAKDAFDADLPQRAGRHDILEGIDKSIDAIDTQIKTMEDKMKK